MQKNNKLFKAGVNKMKFFKMEKWGKISFSIAVVCSIFSIIIVVYVVKISKESWNYRINETECDKKEGTIQKVQSGKKIQNGKVLKFIKIQNGDNICILRKDGQWDEYPRISQKALKSIRKGEKIRYLKDQKNEINNYNLAYELRINKKIYIPIKQMKKIERRNYIKDIGLIIFVTVLSVSMIGLTIYFYWIAETEDMYIR